MLDMLVNTYNETEIWHKGVRSSRGDQGSSTPQVVVVGSVESDESSYSYTIGRSGPSSNNV